MINYIEINRSNDILTDSQNLKSELEKTFKFTKKVNVHVIFDFISPVDVVGRYKYVIFIDVPYESGNYFRSKGKKIYLNSLAIAIREYKDNSVNSIDFDSCELQNGKGNWNYKECIALEKKAIRKFVYENIGDIKHFDISVFHHLSSINCKIKGRKDWMICNCPLSLYEIISFAIEETASNDKKKSNCLVFNNNKQPAWSEFIPQFITISGNRTRQGILTRNKINTISKEYLNKEVKRACEIVGTTLCVINGKAGTGKSLTLMKIMYQKIKKDSEKRNHHCRFLTYNNMLVMDIKHTVKQMGKYTPTNASFSTLHKFFFDIFLRSPVRVLYMDAAQMKRLFSKLHMRVCNMVLLLNSFRNNNPNNEIEASKALEFYYDQGMVSPEDSKEYQLFCRYLKEKNKYVNFNELGRLAFEYIEEKRRMFDEYYAKQEFLNGYNKILEQLYLMFHYEDEFIGKYGMQTIYSWHELRKTEEFKSRYEKHYDMFLEEALARFCVEKNLISEESSNHFVDYEFGMLEEMSRERSKKGNINVDYNEKIKKVRDKLNWSDLIIVDEAQDCNLYEKALLIEMHGADNLVIAMGGKEQLIRQSNETDWSVLFGKPLSYEKIRLDYVHRQKANLVSFVNSFASAFNIDVRLQSSESINRHGKVIIEVGGNFKCNNRIETLYLSGKDHGCTDYENMMFLMPGGNFLECDKTKDVDVNIELNDTIVFRQSSPDRKVKNIFPDHFNIMDGTIKDKRGLLTQVGHDKTRCLLYESCRGLEAWNVVCVDLDDFYEHKFRSLDAELYAEEAGGLFKEEEIIYSYREKYAILWVIMALTRPIDTLYIHLHSRYSYFSQKILEVGRKLIGVEIIDNNPR